MRRLISLIDGPLSPLEDQLRKRLWWALYSYDRISSLNFGRPYVTNDQHIDVDLPASTLLLLRRLLANSRSVLSDTLFLLSLSIDIDNCDLTADGPRNIQPPGIVTDVRLLGAPVKCPHALPC